MTFKRRTGNHAYVGALSVTAMLLALAFAASGVARASARAQSSPSEVVSALVVRGLVVRPGSGFGPHGSPVVRDLQALLVKAGYPIAVDGRYGPLTAQAMMRYQAARGLSANGIAGPRTLAALGAGGVSLHPGAGYPGGSPVVRHLQRLLAREGSSPGSIDGLYGPLTERAIERYQARHGLPVNGIAGRRTLAALIAGGVVLHPGAGYEVAGSSAVRHLQRLLAKAGYRPGPVDGRYGPLTDGAVRRYQAARDLPVTGVVAPRTLSELLSTSGARHAARGKPGARSAPAAPASTALASTVTAPAATAPPKPAPARQRPQSISILWIVLLGLLVVGLCAVALRHAGKSRRAGFIASRTRRPGPSAESESRNDHPPPSAEAEALRHPGGHGDRPSEAEVAVPIQGGDGDGNGDPAAALSGINGIFELGVLLEEKGDLAGAEAAYRRADDRGHATAASNRGVLLEARGERSQAEAAYRRGAQRGGANGAFNLGVLLEERDDLAGAEAAYRHATACGDPGIAQLAHVALDDLLVPAARAGAGTSRGTRRRGERR